MSTVKVTVGPEKWYTGMVKDFCVIHEGKIKSIQRRTKNTPKG